MKLGALVWPQYNRLGLAGPDRAVVDRAGFDTLWTWDHLYPIVGDPDGPMFEGYLTLAAWAEHTDRVRLGLMVGREHIPQSWPRREDGDTLDHISNGRMSLGIGGAWFETEHTAFGIPFGSGSASGSTGSTSRSS